ncbi:hypothetical protein [Actinoplanes sp. NPDC049265]|uniref:hypothetical protein n=1 Tax=Actinoplanes sp. NPDC049265 TaxID=3363902 RepID=UPI0037216BA1
MFLWILVILLIVAVALAGGAYAAGLIGGGGSSSAAAPTGVPTTAPASTAPTGSGGTAASNPGPGTAASTMKVATPATLGGTEKLKTTAKNKPSATPDLFPSTARAEGVFGLDDRNIMYVWALSGATVAQEERAALFGAEVGNRFDTGALIAVEPGPIGGSAQCGDGKWNGRPAAVCVWSDPDSDGVLVDSPGNPEALAGKLSALRAEIEKPA